jgi:3'-phosphoadenosine 5'-phosphosulfate sulfotransferase (PAPS reductase)/FAD synthetase
MKTDLTIYHERIDRALELYQADYVFGLFSGGHDSTVATYIAAQHPAFTAAIHCDTGIGVPETRQFVKDTCKEWGIKLEYMRALDNTRADGTPDPKVWEDFVRAHGFPGPPQHNRMYNMLKERPLRCVMRKYKVGQWTGEEGAKRRRRAILISGCRSQESTRRMGNVEEMQKDGSRIWCAVIHDMSKCDVNRFMADNNLTRNQVVDLIHKSGECLCGAFAKENELKELELWYPKVAKRIRDLEAEVAEKHPWGWEDRKPKWCEEQEKGQIMMQFMCVGCGKGYEDQA